MNHEKLKKFNKKKIMRLKQLPCIKFIPKFLGKEKGLFFVV